MGLTADLPLEVRGHYHRRGVGLTAVLPLRSEDISLELEWV